MKGTDVSFLLFLLGLPRLPIVFGSGIFGLARWRLQFGFQSSVVLLRHPRVEFLAQPHFDRRKLWVNRQVSYLARIGLKVVEFLGGTMEKPLDASSQLGIG